MHSELSTESRNLITPRDTSDLRANQCRKPDTRRFASIFPSELSVPVQGSDATREEHGDDCHDSDDDTSRQWQLVTALDNDSPQAAPISAANVDGCPTLSEAQQVIAYYRAVHGGNYAPERASTEINEVFPQIPDDQRSMCTIPTSADTQSKMDMMWRPKPKVFMHHTDQMALVQAQYQAVTMMQHAGLKPTNQIQCRRHGCADILPGVEALKYHLHIHNIADMATKPNDASPFAAAEPFLAQRTISSPKTSKRNHSHSKSYLEPQHKCPTISFPTRKISIGSLLPSPLSPRESVPEAQHAPSLTSVAKSFVFDPDPNDSTNPPPSCRGTLTYSRGRRARKESMAHLMCADNPSIAMLLSPPSSPDTRGNLAFTPHTNLPVPLPLDPAAGGKNDNHVAPNENTHVVPEKLKGSHGPMRALSPTRAMSPIRNGIKRVLSIGYPVNSSE